MKKKSLVIESIGKLILPRAGDAVREGCGKFGGGVVNLPKKNKEEAGVTRQVPPDTASLCGQGRQEAYCLRWGGARKAPSLKFVG